MKQILLLIADWLTNRPKPQQVRRPKSPKPYDAAISPAQEKLNKKLNRAGNAQEVVVAAMQGWQVELHSYATQAEQGWLAIEAEQGPIITPAQAETLQYQALKMAKINEAAMRKLRNAAAAWRKVAKAAEIMAQNKQI